jgi:hypothetical protein
MKNSTAGSAPCSILFGKEGKYEKIILIYEGTKPNAVDSDGGFSGAASCAVFNRWR